MNNPLNRDNERWFKAMRKNMEKGWITGKLYRFMRKNYPQDQIPWQVKTIVGDRMSGKLKEEVAIYMIRKKIKESKK